MTTVESAVVMEDRPPAPSLIATAAAAVERVILCFTILLRRNQRSSYSCILFHISEGKRYNGEQPPDKEEIFNRGMRQDGSNGTDPI